MASWDVRRSASGGPGAFGRRWRSEGSPVEDWDRECGCAGSGNGGAMFVPAAHAVSAQRLRAECDLSLLEGGREFCSAFFHALDVFEFAGQEGACLFDEDAPGQCSHNAVALVAKLARRRDRDAEDGNDQPLFTARYFNCYRGSGEANVHAEEFMCEDVDLHAALRRACAKEQEGEKEGHSPSPSSPLSSPAPLVLTLYLTYQPCHHSSGGVGRAPDLKSCTERLLAWREEWLAPRGVELRVVVANIYRAVWTDESFYETNVDQRHFTSRTENSRLGLKMLIARGVTVVAFAEKDWTYLAAHTDPETAARVAAHVGERAGTDVHNGRFFEQLRASTEREQEERRLALLLSQARVSEHSPENRASAQQENR